MREEQVLVTAWSVLWKGTGADIPFWDVRVAWKRATFTQMLWWTRGHQPNAMNYITTPSSSANEFCPQATPIIASWAAPIRTGKARVFSRLVGRKRPNNDDRQSPKDCCSPKVKQWEQCECSFVNASTLSGQLMSWWSCSRCNSDAVRLYGLGADRTPSRFEMRARIPLFYPGVPYSRALFRMVPPVVSLPTSVLGPGIF